eukprot:s2313_g16.t1
MPRGTHRGLWKPLPKDIFKPRSGGNTVDRRPPHIQATFTEDVPSPWKFHLYPDQAGNDLIAPIDSRNVVGTYLGPAYEASEGTASDVVLRCLDAGRRGSGSLSGLGRPEAVSETQQRDKDLAPQHIRAQLMELCGGKPPEEVIAKQTRFFKVRRLMNLLEEQDDARDAEIVWSSGRRLQTRRAARSRSADDPRGNFPYIDEKAGLLDELDLAEILRVNYKTNSRRLPKWKEIQFWFKKWTSSQLALERHSRIWPKELEDSRLEAYDLFSAFWRRVEQSQIIDTMIGEDLKRGYDSVMDREGQDRLLSLSETGRLEEFQSRFNDSTTADQYRILAENDTAIPVLSEKLLPFFVRGMDDFEYKIANTPVALPGWADIIVGTVVVLGFVLVLALSGELQLPSMDEKFTLERSAPKKIIVPVIANGPGAQPGLAKTEVQSIP